MESISDTEDHRSLFGSEYESRPPSRRDESMSDDDHEPMTDDDLIELMGDDELTDEDEHMDEDERMDEDEPGSYIESLTLVQFAAKALELRKKDKAAFCRFVLTGTYRGRQIQVDPIKNALRGHHHLQTLRDFDSMLGIHEHICVSSFIAINPVSNKSDTLSRNIHIKYSFSNQSGEHINVPVHTIPNLCLGKWGTHNMLRVLILALYDKERKSPFLSQDQLSTFYLKALRPAMESLVPDSTAEWPPTYRTELSRARGKNGTYSFQHKTLAGWYVRDLGDRIREALSDNHVPWAQGLVFLHQIRGVKSSSGHTPNHQSAVESFEEFLDEHRMTQECRTEGHWWVDVGLEIASKDKLCLAFRTDSHPHIVREALEIPPRHANRITSLGSSKYIRDLTSHLTSVSGCRISPGARAKGPHHAVYLQMYTTDKSLTYRPDGSHFGKFMTGRDIIQNKADDFCSDLYEIYREAATRNHCLARVEVRVPLAYASDALLKIDIETIRKSLVAVDRAVWWSLRAYRLYAFKYILEQQALGEAAYRATDSALLLTAAAPWFINGLHSTPDNGPASRDLMSKILPLTHRTTAEAETLLYRVSTRVRTAAVDKNEDEPEDVFNAAGPVVADHLPEDNMSVVSDLSDTARPAPIYTERGTNRAEVLPYAPYGIVFLRPIRIGEGVNMPRFQDSTVPMVAWKSFKYIFGIRRDNIDILLFKTNIVVPHHPTRVANRVRRTPAHAPEHPVPPIFNLSERGYALEAPVDDTGSDLEDLRDEIRHRDGDEDKDIDTQLTSLWNQFLLDLSAKAPNRKKAEEFSYCILSPDERRNVTEDTYKNLHLSDYFNDCQWRKGTKDLWVSAFNKFWPLYPVQVQRSQNLPSMSYYIRWHNLLEQMRRRGQEDQEDQEDPEDTIVEMRRELRARFDSLGWIPHPDSTRVWYTKRDKKLYKKFSGTDPEKAAPRVLIQCGRTPTF